MNRTCTIADCTEQFFAKGFCIIHYRQDYYTKHTWYGHVDHTWMIEVAEEMDKATCDQCGGRLYPKLTSTMRAAAHTPSARLKLEPYVARLRENRRYCSGACRQKAYRQRKASA